jgi:hypothetical protein
MKHLGVFFLLVSSAFATVIEIVPIYQPVSLHGSDIDDEVDVDSGESLQAAIMSVPMALTGDFPEVLVRSVALPLRLQSNNQNYDIAEVNLCQLCGVKIEVEIDDPQECKIAIDVSALHLPKEIDLTSRQVVKLVAAAIRRTLTDYNKNQKKDLQVTLAITGTVDTNATLQDLNGQYTVPGAAN